MYPFYERKNDILYCELRNKLDCDPHFHSHLEMAYVLSGSTRMYIDDVAYDVNKGDIIISFPEQVHYFSEDNNISAYLLIFKSSYVPILKEHIDSHRPVMPLLSLNGDDKIEELLNLLYAESTDEKKSSDCFSESLKSSILSSVLSLLFQRMTFEDNKSKGESLLKNIIDYCSEHCCDEISLSLVADAMHINKYYLSHIFSDRMNISFSDYINHLRIREATDLLLQSNKSISEISEECGYGSLRTFNRAFAKYKSMTPSAFRAINR